jgi:hypothetical protein
MAIHVLNEDLVNGNRLTVTGGMWTGAFAGQLAGNWGWRARFFISSSCSEGGVAPKLDEQMKNVSRWRIYRERRVWVRVRVESFFGGK